MPDPETLAREAAGDSVTVERLVGDADGFPNLGPFLLSGQEPQHLIPLDTSDRPVDVGIGYSDGIVPGGFPAEILARQSRLAGHADAVAVLTWDEVLVVYDESFFEVPYDVVSGVLRSENELEIHRTGARDAVLYVADDADRSAVRAAITHLRQGVRHHRNDE